jgi:hypothetical protein
LLVEIRVVSCIKGRINAQGVREEDTEKFWTCDEGSKKRLQKLSK